DLAVGQPAPATGRLLGERGGEERVGRLGRLVRDPRGGRGRTGRELLGLRDAVEDRDRVQDDRDVARLAELVERLAVRLLELTADGAHVVEVDAHLDGAPALGARGAVDTPGGAAVLARGGRGRPLGQVARRGGAAGLVAVGPRRGPPGAGAADAADGALALGARGAVDTHGDAAVLARGGRVRHLGQVARRDGVDGLVAVVHRRDPHGEEDADEDDDARDERSDRDEAVALVALGLGL